MKYVLDASVVTKWFVEEEDSDRATKFLDDYSQGKCEISEPDLLIYSVDHDLSGSSQCAEI